MQPKTPELPSTREETAKVASDLGLMPTILEFAKVFGYLKSITIYKNGEVVADYESEKINYVRTSNEGNGRGSSESTCKTAY